MSSGRACFNIIRVWYKDGEYYGEEIVESFCIGGGGSGGGGYNHGDGWIGSGGGNTNSNPATDNDCERFVGTIVSAVEKMRNDFAARLNIGGHFADLTRQLFKLPSAEVTGFFDRLVQGGQNNDVFRHVTFGVASVLLDGIGLVSAGDSFFRQDLGITAGGSREAREASKEGNRAGERIGHLIATRIRGSITSSDLRDKVFETLCEE